MNIKTRNIFGFTLIELLVVMSIISLLSSVVLSNLNDARAKARDSKRKAQITSIINALIVYYSTHEYYPNISYAGACGTKIDGTDIVSTSLAADGLMTSAPVVPSNSGTCGDSYYGGQFLSQQGIAILTKLEKNDPNCKAWPADSSGWYLTGSYCNGYFVQVLR